MGVFFSCTGAIAALPHDHSAYGHRSAELLWSVQAMSMKKPRDELEPLLEHWASETFAKLEPYFTVR